MNYLPVLLQINKLPYIAQAYSAANTDEVYIELIGLFQQALPPERCVQVQSQSSLSLEAVERFFDRQLDYLSEHGEEEIVREGRAMLRGRG